MPDTRWLHQVLDDLEADRQARSRIGWGMLIAALPVVSAAAVGYQVALARQVAEGPLQAMPGWRPFGRLFRLGLGLALVHWLYALPGQVLLLGALAVLAGPLIATMAALGPAAALAAVRLAPWQLGLAALLAAGWAVYDAACGLLAPAVTLQYVRCGRVRACFDPRAFADYAAQRRLRTVRAWVSRGTFAAAGRLALVGLSLAVGGVPIVGTVILFLATGWLRFFSLVVRGHLIGQWLRGEESSGR